MPVKCSCVAQACQWDPRQQNPSFNNSDNISLWSEFACLTPKSMIAVWASHQVFSFECILKLWSTSSALKKKNRDKNPPPAQIRWNNVSHARDISKIPIREVAGAMREKEPWASRQSSEPGCEGLDSSPHSAPKALKAPGNPALCASVPTVSLLLSLFFQPLYMGIPWAQLFGLFSFLSSLTP